MRGSVAPLKDTEAFERLLNISEADIFDSLGQSVNLLSLSRFMKDEQFEEDIKNQIVDFMSVQLFRVASDFNLSFSSAVAVLFLVKYIDAKLFVNDELLLKLLNRRKKDTGQTWLEAVLAEQKQFVNLEKQKRGFNV